MLMLTLITALNISGNALIISSTESAPMSDRSNGVEWIETTEEVVVVTEECIAPENSTQTGISLLFVLHSC